MDIAEVLRSHAEFVERRCIDGEAVAVDMRRAAKELERLQAIPDKLPKGVVAAVLSKLEGE